MSGVLRSMIDISSAKNTTSKPGASYIDAEALVDVPRTAAKANQGSWLDILTALYAGHGNQTRSPSVEHARADFNLNIW